MVNKIDPLVRGIYYICLLGGKGSLWYEKDPEAALELMSIYSLGSKIRNINPKIAVEELIKRNDK
ncbi:hypothetical protein LCGC14_2984160 [marine sediment metagenome]|uniref:Uncharacterized protein n=1 Tax=marine sediment metagenome TaxID=412755 RepID=A0A0F8X5R7_9ZZZZ